VFLNTLALVQYRLEDWESARATLVRAEPLNGARFEGPWPRDLALRAMLQARQGQREAARATLERLRDVLKAPRWANADEGRGLQRQAEALLENKKPSH
jgi:hypothetical protein